MNWQTKDIIKRTKEAISDEGVFSTDQISLLMVLIDGIAAAIDKEASSKVQNYTM